MRSFNGLNYYQILKIRPNSSFVEIKRAYQDALAIYREGSLATYSLFSPDDRVQILNAIEKAYITLIDEDKRAAYDRMLAVTAQVENSDLDAKVQNRPIPLFNKKIL